MTEQQTSSEEVEKILSQYKPLDSRILGMVKDIPVWNFKTVKKLFSQEHDKSIYRALKKLEDSGSIKFVGYHGRLKQYSCYGVSNLPTFTNSEGGKATIKDWATHIDSQYDESGNWKLLEKFNEFPALLGQIFLIAKMDGDDLVKDYRELIRQLVDIKTALDTFESYITVLMMHPIMQDHEVFKRIVTSEQFDPAELHKLMVSLNNHNKIIMARKANKNND